MGVCIHRIEFAQSLPSFDALSRQFKNQTGLNLRLIPAVHLAAGDADAPLPAPQQLTAALARDASAVADLEADDASAQAPLRSTGRYEAAAVNRDRFKAAKDQLTHISYLELAVDFGGLHLFLIDSYIRGNRIELWQYTFPSYIISSLIKCLLELGGQLRGADERQLQALHQEWRRLKWWQHYRWYNRPRR